MNKNRNNNNQIVSHIGNKSILFNNNMKYKSPLLKNCSAKNNEGIKIRYKEPIKNVKKFQKKQINLTSYMIPKPMDIASLNINKKRKFDPFSGDINDINFVFINNNIKISPKQNKKIQLTHSNTLKEIKDRFINNGFQTYNNY